MMVGRPANSHKGIGLPLRLWNSKSKAVFLLAIWVPLTVLTRSSSDEDELHVNIAARGIGVGAYLMGCLHELFSFGAVHAGDRDVERNGKPEADAAKIGRASCRERVCQYV